MQKVFLLLFLIFSWELVFSQVSERVDHQQEIVIDTIKPTKRPFDVRLPIIKAMRTTALLDSLIKAPEDNVFLLSVAVSFNAVGLVDTVYFSENMRARLKAALKPSERMKASIAKNLSDVKSYKNEVILFPILFTNARHTKMDKNTFEADFKSLWPVLSARDQNRKLTLLEPYHQWVNAHH
ncbi:hypothetical protein [Pedobacter deserti]|uniref:hypothetical protein n=1 Tax=Pedobacter deserti TaxID=2817382 RepID=UPI00210B1109|nr:hypothetical protein [Pedobacter sp. SYSU D00382]